jgi:hypothetical protein
MLAAWTSFLSGYLALDPAARRSCRGRSATGGRALQGLLILVLQVGVDVEADLADGPGEGEWRLVGIAPVHRQAVSRPMSMPE